MSTSIRNTRRKVLATSISVALLGAIVSPAGATDPNANPQSRHVRLPDIGGSATPSRDPKDEAFEALTWVAQAGSADAAINGAINRSLSAGVDAMRDSGLPFLGSLQGSVRWNDANNAFDIDLVSLYAFSGNGEGHNWLMQLGAHNDAQRLTANAGLVYRWVDLESQWLLGGNLFMDHDFDGGVSRVGVGAEAATGSFRAFTNAYAPVAGWQVSPDDSMIEERAARGYDLGLSWTPRSFDIFDLTATGSQWQGGHVDVFGNGSTERDPTVWSLKAALQPVPALGISAEHKKIKGGGTDSIVALSYTYHFGRNAAEQFVAAPRGQRNDIRERALLPVEREKRIVTETRERYAAPSFATAGANLTVIEGDAFLHTLVVASGAGAVRLTLSGPDAALFSLDGNTLHLPAQSADAPADAGADNFYDVIVTATDDRGATATHVVRVEVLSTTPLANNAGLIGVVGAPVVGDVLGVTYEFHSPIGDTEDTDGLRVEWFRQSAAQPLVTLPEEAPVIIAEGLQYTVTQDDVGHHVGARITLRSAGGRITRPVNVLSDIVQGVANTAPTATVSLTGELVVGATLTGAYTFNDVDGDAEGATAMQWYRQDDATGTGRVAIAGATGLQYTLTAQDKNKYVAFQVIPFAATGAANGAAVTITSANAVSLVGEAPTLAGVTVTGTHVVGEALIATPHGYADANGDLPGTHLYQWFRATDAQGVNRTLISGANSSNYFIQAADANHYLVLQVTPVSATGTPAHGAPVFGMTGLITVAVAGAAPSLVGVEMGASGPGWFAGSTVTALPIGFADADNDLPGTHLYQWYIASDFEGTDAVAMLGETQSTYTLKTSDQGKFISVEVTPVSATGVPSVGTPKRAQANDVRGRVPSLVSVALSGTPSIGQTITGTANGLADVDGDELGTPLYQWYLADNADGTSRSLIAGATSSTYTIQSGDAGKYLVLQITPVSLTGTPGSRQGTPKSDVLSGVIAVGGTAPSLVGVEMGASGPGWFAGSTVTALPIGFADADNDLPGTHLYQWYIASDFEGTDAVAMLGETQSTYTLKTSDQGKFISVEVTPVSATGVPSVGTPKRAQANDVRGRVPSLASVALSGTPSIGQTITGTANGLTDIDGDELGTPLYQWYLADNADGTGRSLIAGATSSTYTIQSGDAGKYLVLQITPVSLTGTPGSRQGTPKSAVLSGVIDSPAAAPVALTGWSLKF